MTNLVMQRKMIGWTLILAVGTLTGFLSFAVFEAAVATGAPPLLPDGGSGPRGVIPGVPMQINHQGVVQSGGIRFNGNGLFRFAIVDPDTGNQVWTNDGTNTPGPGAPTAAVSVTVMNGVYSVLLGDASLTNMAAVPGSIFSDGNLVLRIWFDDGANGVQQLAPDHALSTSPYTFRAATATDADTLGGLDLAAIIAAADTTPAGTIAAFGGPTAPSGWLLCDGSQVDRITEAALFAVVGTAWGSGDGSTTFHLPDLRGRFLRGVSGPTGNDPDAGARVATNSGGNTGNDVGSFQEDNLASHNHAGEGSGGNLFARISHTTPSPNNITWKSIQGTPTYSPDSAITAGGMTVGNAPASLTAGVQVGGTTAFATGPLGSEDNRPVNCYVHYIIKQ